MKNVVIIGAGIGGLSAGALLAKKGYNVTILEKNSQPGGRAGVWKKNGFVFDMGPSWYLMPDVFEKFFKIFGEKPENFFKLKKLDPSYRIFFEGEGITDIPSDYRKTMELFKTFEENGDKKLGLYLKQSEFLYKESLKHFIYRDYRSFKDFFRKEIILNGPKMHIFDNLAKFIGRYFSEDKLKKILSYSIVFLGGSPKNTPALYSMMSYIDFKMGVWYPMGGINELVSSLVALCKRHNVKIYYNQPVSGYKFSDKKITHVKSGKKEYGADLVVVNADYAFAETKLLPEKFQTYPEKYWNKKTIAPSAFILYLGIGKKLKKLKHHNLFLEKNWEEHFEEIFNKPSWPANPSYYICAPSKTDPSVAPAGKENLFILVPVSSNLKDNVKNRKIYRDKILKHLEELIGEKFIDDIEVERIFSINDFSTLYNSYKGTALGLSHMLMQSALFRPSHKSKKVNNLYYTGQYTHPGIGMPVCLISSQIVSEMIESDE